MDNVCAEVTVTVCDRLRTTPDRVWPLQIWRGSATVCSTSVKTGANCASTTTSTGRPIGCIAALTVTCRGVSSTGESISAESVWRVSDSHQTDCVWTTRTARLGLCSTVKSTKMTILPGVCYARTAGTSLQGRCSVGRLFLGVWSTTPKSFVPTHLRSRAFSAITRIITIWSRTLRAIFALRDKLPL